MAPKARASRLTQASAGAPRSAPQAAVPSNPMLASRSSKAPITVVTVVVVNASTPLSTSRPISVYATQQATQPSSNSSPMPTEPGRAALGPLPLIAM